MVKAVWNGNVIAQSEQTIVVEGNYYFPPEAVESNFLVESETTSTCPWKGLASYYDIKVGDQVNRDAAWYYPQPKKAAEKIKNYVAFWRGVQIIES
ncbi:MAG: DUF427 domain-containing protein [Anaerolineales bacterium]|nr:DUF427 domain-containing protein [Anaerolineales bacterium]